MSVCLRECHVAETSQALVPDGCKVCNYAQWESLADFQAMLKKPEAQTHMKSATALAQSVAQSVTPILCTVVSSHGGEARTSHPESKHPLQLY
jgi:hypothetical protein